MKTYQRLAFAGALAAAAAGIGYNTLSEQTRTGLKLRVSSALGLLSEADKRTKDFDSEKVPGASRVTTYLMPGSKHCLVHIAQMHYTRFTDQTFNKKIIEEVKKTKKAVDSDTRQILLYLINRFSLEQVYLEDFIPRNERALDLLCKIGTPGNLERSIMDELRLADELRMEFPSGPQRKRIDESAEYTRSLLPAAREFDKYDPLGAVGVLVHDKNLRRIKGAETDETLSRSLREVERAAAGGKDAEFKLVYTDREDALLRIIADQNSGDIMPVTVFGGAHYWLDNIKAWNEKNPNSKFSLVEIMPQSHPLPDVRAK